MRQSASGGQKVSRLVYTTDVQKLRHVEWRDAYGKFLQDHQTNCNHQPKLLEERQSEKVKESKWISRTQQSKHFKKKWLLKRKTRKLDPVPKIIEGPMESSIHVAKNLRDGQRQNSAQVAYIHSGNLFSTPSRCSCSGALPAHPQLKKRLGAIYKTQLGHQGVAKAAQMEDYSRWVYSQKRKCCLVAPKRFCGTTSLPIIAERSTWHTAKNCYYAGLTDQPVIAEDCDMNCEYELCSAYVQRDFFYWICPLAPQPHGACSLYRATVSVCNMSCCW